jgi:hypothetical protein
MPNFPASIPNSDYSIVSRRDARAGLPTRPQPRRSLIAPPAWSSTPVCSTTSANRLEAGADAGRHAPPPVLRGHGRNRRQDLKLLISTISVSFRKKMQIHTSPADESSPATSQEWGEQGSAAREASRSAGGNSPS